MRTEKSKENSWSAWNVGKALLATSAVIAAGTVSWMLLSMFWGSEGAVISQLDEIPKMDTHDLLLPISEAETTEVTTTSFESQPGYPTVRKPLSSDIGVVNLKQDKIFTRDAQPSDIERIFNSLSDQTLFPGENSTSVVNANNLFSDPDGGFLLLDVEVDGQPSELVAGQLDPRLVGSQDTPSSGKHVDISDQTAFIPNGIAVEIVSVADPAKPETIQSYSVPGCNPEDIEVVGSQIYVAGGTVVYVASIEDPNNPQLLGSYTAPSPAKTIDVDRNVAAVTMNPSGLLFLNVTTADPELYSTRADTVLGVQLAYHRAYLAKGSAGFEILDMQDPANPITLASFSTQGSAVAAKVVNDETAYVIDSPSYFMILDVRNATAPVLLNRYRTPGNATDIDVIGSTVFIIDNLGLHIVDASDSTHPVLLASYKGLNAIRGIRVANNFAYVIDASAGLQVIDLSQWKMITHPKAEDIGNHDVVVTATDVLGSTASTSFTAKVQGPPVFSGVLGDQVGTVNDAFYALVPPAIDPNLDPVELHADGLPPGLQFNPISGVVAGTPTAASDGTVTITATDNIAGSTQTSFDLKVGYQPEIAATIRNPAPFREGKEISYTIPADAFSDPNGNGLLFSVSSDNGKLPDWLKFNANTRTFSGVPPVGNNSKLTVIVTATDSVTDSSVSQRVQFSTEINQAPVLAKPLSEQRAEVGQSYKLVLDRNMFSDPNNDRLNITVSGLAKWQRFDPKTLTIFGKPGIGDTGTYTPKEYPIKVTVSDGEFSAHADINIAVYGRDIWALLINSASGTIGALTFLYSLYKARALLLNCFSSRYDAPGSIKNNPEDDQEVFIPLDCDPELIKTVQARIPLSSPNSCWSKTTQCLFGSTVAFFGAYLPHWLKYSREHNALIIDPNKLTLNDIGQLVIEVRGSDFVLRRCFDIEVSPESGRFAIKVTAGNDSVTLQTDAYSFSPIISSASTTTHFVDGEEGIPMSPSPASPSP